MMKRIFISLVLLVGCCACAWAQSAVKLVEQRLAEADDARTLSTLDSLLRISTDDNIRDRLNIYKAEVLIHLGRLEDAASLLDFPPAYTPSVAIQALSEATRGYLHLNQGRNDRALESLQKALSTWEGANLSNTLDAAQTLAYLGTLYTATGKYHQAEEHLTMALNIRRSLVPETSELMAASYNDLGLAYSNTDPDKALEYFEKAQAIYIKLHGPRHPKTAIASTNIGYLYRQLELYGDAVNNFENALSIWEQVYTQPHPSKAFVLFNLGQTYARLNDQSATRAFYEKARAQYEACYGKKHPELARLYNALAGLDLSSGNYDQALQRYQQALMANVRDFNTADLRRTPTLEAFYDGPVLLNSLLGKARTLEARHYNKSLRFDELDLALQNLHTCDTLIDKMRQQINSEQDKLTLGTIAADVYADGVRIAYEAAQVAWRKAPYREAAFYFAERSKSAVLLEAISEANAKSYAGIPADLLNQEQELKSAIALCAQKLAQKPSDDEERYLRETAFSLHRNYEAFIRQLETSYPEYFNLKFNTTAPSLPDIQARLDGATAVLSYFQDEKESRIYIFIITQRGYKIVSHKLPADFDRYITGFRNSIYFRDTKTYLRAAPVLSQLLLPRQEIPAAIRHLVIIPSGRLGIIPFEALLAGKGNAETTAQPYAVNRYTLRYEFSAGLILQKKIKPPVQSPSIFLCAPISFNPEDALPDLPGTASEVVDIAALFAGQHLSTGIYRGPDAHEGIVKSAELKKYYYLHFATHGVVDEANPELSRIYLHHSNSGDDGHLYASEIYNLQLQANLVTLSACQTGLGKISKGEGVIGLSRALVYAGAQNSLVSYWSVADASTAVLMKNFYTYLLQHPEAGLAQALQQAKQQLMADQRYAAPYYWAPFVLLGF